MREHRGRGHHLDTRRTVTGSAGEDGATIDTLHDQPQQDLYAAAVKWHESGCSVIPIRADGTKKPAFAWKRNQVERVSPLQWMPHEAGGIGIVCGKVSGDLEMLELEGRATSEQTLMAICDATERLGVGHLWDRLMMYGYVESTPSGGLHILYRIVDRDVPGNTKIARRPATPEELAIDPEDRIKVLSETRGEGGYVIVAPSGGAVHSTGLGWEVEAGEIGNIPTVVWAERCLLHQAIYEVLDEMPEPVSVAPQPRPVLPTTGQLRPGDDYNNRADWREILEPHGWQIHSTHGQETFWTRPGKERRDGHSASTGYSADGDRLFVWSSSTVFETEVPYSKFAAYATLNHGGDMAESARYLGRLGYGEKRQVSVPHEDIGSSTVDSVPTGPPPAEDEPSPIAAPRPQYCSSHVGNAERMLDTFGRDFRFVPATKEWMVWDGTRWRDDYGQVHVSQAVVKMTYRIKREAEAIGLDDPDGKSLYRWFLTSQMDNGVKGTISRFGRMPDMAARPEEFDDNPGLLNLPNGVYDLDRHQLLPHDRKYMATQMFGARFEPDAKCPKFQQLIATLLPDEQVRAFVQRAVGYTLLGRPDQRAMFITHGPKRTGKSQFHNILSLLFGDYAGTAQAGSFHRVDRRGDGATPGLHMLRNKRFVTTSEESEHAVLDTESLKRLTGNEAITTRALYQDGVRWRPQMVLWMATNPLPQLNSDDDAIWDRVKPVPFTTKFSAKGEPGTIRETPGIAERIFADEASGILNWALAGLRMFQEQGGLDQPERVEQGVADYRHETDPVSQFWEQMTEAGVAKAHPEGRVEFQILYRAYSDWCQSSREYCLSSRRFGRRLRAIIGANDFVRSNGRYYVPGYMWLPVGGVLGSWFGPNVGNNPQGGEGT